MPVHPESVDDDARALRWVMPAGTLSFVGAPTGLPESVQNLLDDGTLTALSVEPAAVRTALAAGKAWRDHGPRVRSALQAALATPDQWWTSAGGAGDAKLSMAVRQVIDGEIGDYIRSHGGLVELVGVHDDEVEVRLSGACSHCPASDVTLTERLEVGIRALHPGLRRLTAQGNAGAASGRRMLRLFAVKGH